jgi:tRNA1(Val) A37 N6-methylase TrmN6
MPNDNFDEADLTQDGFLGGALKVWQPRRGYRAAMDPVLLAATVPAMSGQSVLELGCGVGVASLCLGHRVPGLRQSGVELQPAYADLARRNAAENGIALEVILADLARLPAGLRARSFDHVIANPPYFSAADGTAAIDSGREAAQREATPLALWIDTGLRRLGPTGMLTVIQSADRLGEILTAIGTRGAITILPVAARTGRDAGRVIVQARKGSRARLRLMAPLVLHEGMEHAGDRDSHRPQVAAILRHGAAFRL